MKTEHGLVSRPFVFNHNIRVSVASSRYSLLRNYKTLYLKSGSVPQGIRRQLSNKLVCFDLYNDLEVSIVTGNVTLVDDLDCNV